MSWLQQQIEIVLWSFTVTNSWVSL